MKNVDLITAELTPRSAEAVASSWRMLVILALLALLYLQVGRDLVLAWWQDPNFSHGFLVPLFVTYVTWHRRDRLATSPVTPSWWGIPIVTLSLTMLLAGIFGVELFLSRTSFVMLLGGLVISFFGWQWFRVLLFPWVCLFLMIPIPAIVFNQVAFPLQLLASKLAAFLLSWVGVPVLRAGNVIELPAMPLEIAEACSGIRSLVSLITLATIYGFFLKNTAWRRLLLVIVAVPIAVMVNALRIVGTGLLVQYWDPDRALGFFHEFSGWLMFVLSVALLFVVHRAMNMPRKDRGDAL